MNTELKTDHIYTGHALDILRGMPSASVDCLVTSPPYWSQRNYGTKPQIWGGDANCNHQFKEGKYTEFTAKRDHSGNNFSDVRGQQASSKPLALYSAMCAKSGAHGVVLFVVWLISHVGIRFWHLAVWKKRNL